MGSLFVWPLILVLYSPNISAKYLAIALLCVRSAVPSMISTGPWPIGNAEKVRQIKWRQRTKVFSRWWPSVQMKQPSQKGNVNIEVAIPLYIASYTTGNGTTLPYTAGTRIRHFKALQKSPWKLIIWTNDL